MNDDRQGANDRLGMAPMIGFALGAIAGGVLALLLAPASGEVTRRRIGDAARRMSDDTRQALDQARETVTEAAVGLGADARAVIAAGRETFSHDGTPHERHPVSRIAEALKTPPASP